MAGMAFAEVNGITLHYAREGVEEGIPLVFINSLGSDFRIWNGVILEFKNLFPIIRYDKRGHGLSDCPLGPYTIRDNVNDLVGLLDRLAVESVILIGVSVGGMIALDFAVSHQHRVKALVLGDTAAKIGTATYWDERIRAIEQSGMEHMAREILLRWFAPSFAEQHPAAYQGYLNLLTRTPVDGYIATCAALRDADLRGHLEEIRVKSLVLCGAEDTATPPDLVREFAGILPDSQFQLIEKAGHTPSVEQPASMAFKINQFLRKNGYGETSF